MERRTLRLPSYDAVGADAEALLALGYDRAGSWGLGQACHHLATIMEMSLDGFPSRFPWPVRLAARWFFLGKILRHHVFRRRFPAPKFALPPEAADDRAGVARLRAVLGRLQGHAGEMRPSPVFGRLSPEQWREVHLWHCEHHLSFLLPRAAQPTAADHEAVTIEQFTRQAEPFAALHTVRSDAAIIDRMREAARVGPGSTVLDVACGPGLVALALAPGAGQVTGLDLTPAMLAKARELQQQSGLANLTWQEGRADALPYPEGSFDVVLTRFSFHHFTDPAKVLAEMVRVCRPGGRVVVCDVYTRPEQAAEYDRLERLRDPSHVRALPLEELRALLRHAGLAEVEEAFARLPTGVEQLLAASFPVPGGADEVRRALAADVGRDRLGLGVQEQDGRLVLSFPVVVLAGTKPG
jgi:ubiquinone/menaquinone biosynthesis C-methylase UbiE